MKAFLITLVSLGVLYPAASQLEAEASNLGSPRFMQGPMIGAVTSSDALIWLRASGPFDCQIEYSEDPALKEATVTPPEGARKADDYTVRVRITDLRPDTRYYYRPLVQGKPGKYLKDELPYNFTTAPVSGTPGRFRVAFGSCTRVKESRSQPIWRFVEEQEPDLFFHLGDYVYGDSLDPDILAEEYQFQRDVELLRLFQRTVPQLATWDDHEYGLNDHDRTSPMREHGLRIFKQYWANPSYGLPDTPGVFFSYQYGGVDFFFLDVRYHRDPNVQPDSPEKTMLGAGQLRWLKEGLIKSEAPFKVLISGSGWTKAKEFGEDSWASFIQERDALFDFIRDNDVNGVILLSGDTHVGELNAIPWSDKGGYDFYDLVSSPLAQDSAGDPRTTRKPELRIRARYHGLSVFGLIEFDLTGDPTLRFNLINEYGNSVWRPFEIAASELQNGVQSWPEKTDPGLQ
jgi:alkaline phosphatase D